MARRDLLAMASLLASKINRLPSESVFLKSTVRLKLERTAIFSHSLHNMIWRAIRNFRLNFDGYGHTCADDTNKVDGHSH